MITDAPPIPQNGIPLQPVRDGRAPSYRLKNAADAQTLCANLWQAAQMRNLKNSAIQGQIDGNPPYSPTKMRAQGRAGDPNFNTLEAKALLSTALVPYYDLFAGATHYLDARTDFGSSKERSKWSGIINEEFDRLLSRWPSFDYVMQQMIRDFLLFGKAYLSWDDDRSWRFSKVSFYRVLVPDATSINLDELDVVVVLQDWPVHKLWEKISDRSSARALGWNISETLQAIEGAVPVDPSTPNDPIASQQQLRDNDLYVSSKSSKVQTATLYVREIPTGKWSECMVRRNTVPNDTQRPPPAGYMFEKRARYDSLLEAVVPFFFETLDGSWNGASGLGRDIFTLMQLKDRLACTQAQSVFLRNSLVLQPRQALDKSRMNLLQIGAVTWVPEGVEVLQSTILGDIESTIAVTREMSAMIQRNTGIYMPTIEKEQGQGNPQTLGEFNTKFAQAMTLSNAAVNRFYAQLDRFYQEMFKRVISPDPRDNMASKEAKMFLKRLDDRDVPREALKKMASIRAWRNIGNGSVAARQQALSNFMGLYPQLHANGQESLLRDIISTSGSQSQVERYMPPDDWDGVPNDQEWAAMQENAAMKIGAPALWTPSQNNIIHAETHLTAASQAAASLQQGAPMIEVLTFLDAVGPHVTMHLQRESANPMSKQQVAALGKQLNRLASFTDKLKAQVKQQAEQQAKQQQRTQQALSDQQLSQMEVEGKLQLSRAKAAELVRLKGERQQADIGLKVQRQQADIALADADTAASIQRDNAIATAELELERLESANKAKSNDK